MITLNEQEIQTLLNNMSREDNAARVRYLALIESPTRIEFSDEDSGEEFSPETVALIWAAARERSYYCYSCETSKPVREWTRDSSNVDLCAECMEDAEWENAHSDYNHEATPDPDCPICKAKVAT